MSRDGHGRPRGGTTHVRCHPPAGFSGMPAVKAEPPFLSVEGGMAAEASAGGCASSTCAGDPPPDPYERFTATFSRLL